MYGELHWRWEEYRLISKLTRYKRRGNKRSNKLLIKLSLQEVGTEKEVFYSSYLLSVGIQLCLTVMIKTHAFGRTRGSETLQYVPFIPNKLS